MDTQLPLRTLPPAPSSAVDDSGAPRFGAYQGSVDRVGLERLDGSWRRGRLYRVAHHKKWLWGFLATGETMAGFAIVDLTYAANAFAFALDLANRRVLADATSLGLPLVSCSVRDRPGAGARASFAGPGAKFLVERPVGSSTYRLKIRAKGIEIDAELDTSAAPPPLTLVASVEGGTVNVTQKSVGLAARGRLACGDRTFALDGGYGGFDYTHGLLGRVTQWRWAFGTGRSQDGSLVGFNLVHGFNEAASATENVVWVDGAPVALGPVRFAFDAKTPTAPWRITSEDGRVDLTLDPAGQHREERNLVIARSYFVQVFGTYRGTLDVGAGPVRIAGLPGVAEDQNITW